MMRIYLVVATAAFAALACGSSKPPSETGGVADAAPPSGDSGSAAKLDSGSTAKPDGGSTAKPDSGSTAKGDGGGTATACTSTTPVTGVDAGPSPGPGVPVGAVPGPGTFVAGCMIFPADNAWNVDISSPKIATTSIYTGIPQSTTLHPDLGGWSGSSSYGIPFNVVGATQPEATVTFNLYAAQSDPGPGGWTTDPASGGNGVTGYPFPVGMKIEGDPAAGQTPGDDHALVLVQGATCGAPCTVYETWLTVGGASAPWTASNGAKWNLASNELRPLGWTSADAAGLSVFAGLLRLEELKAGVITHAIRVTFNNFQEGYVYPATHLIKGSAIGGSDPPMGLRLRLKASFNASGLSGPGKIVAKAMQTYGLIVADKGSDWFFQGDSDDGWNDNDPAGNDTYVGELLTDFRKVSGADFDVIDPGTPINTGS